MTYAFIQDVPADEAMYEQVRTLIGAEVPKGLVSHVVLRRERGLRYIDVWESQADWEQFRDERAEPAVGKVLASLGLPHDHSMVTFEEIDVIDTWLGTTSAR